IEPELLDHDLLVTARIWWARPASRHRGDTRGELAHRERLDEVVVSPQLERVDAVVLSAARRDDDDRRSDGFVARLLDHERAIGTREHEVEDADIRSLEAESLDAGLAVRDGDRVETSRLEMPRHAAGDDVVVLDDQHLGHAPGIVNGPRAAGGRQLVSEW